MPPPTPPSQAETAFVRPLTAANTHQLRWFTPATEVPLCGHATLAAAAALVAAGAAAVPSTLTFETLHSGVLRVAVSQGDGGDPYYELDLPCRPPTDAPPPCAATITSPLVAALTAGSPACPASVAFNADLQYVVVVLEVALSSARTAVASLTPRVDALLAAAPSSDVSGIIATALGHDGTIYSRFWGPWLGVDEDAVTGSAHAVLAPLWLGGGDAARAVTTRAEQLSTRGGELKVALTDGGRVRVGGGAGWW